MTHLDLFSGIGGFALAARWAGLETIQFVEIEKFAQQVLSKNFPGIPIHDNIKTFNATKFRGCGLVTGGYPCQPFSQAGKRRGEEDDRHLWPEMFRVIREARSSWVLCENVAGHITMGLDKVLSDLEGEGYSCQSFVIPAVAKDARHRRDRVWILAHAKYGADRTNGGREREEDSLQVINRQEGLSGLSGGTGSDTEDVAYSKSFNDECSYKERRSSLKSGNSSRGSNEYREWATEPPVGRVAHGIPSRVDRLKGLGNAIVPQVAYEIIRHIKTLTKEKNGTDGNGTGKF
jgi:DNA (cytosine-5)-methyltransferase 1